MSEQKPIPKTMQAIRLHGKSFDQIEVDEVPVPEPNDDQLLARVDAAGVCASNLKLIAQGSEHTLMNGWDMETYPLTLGDEGCVTVVKAGANVVDRFPEGTRFATQPAVDHPPINHRDRYHNGKATPWVSARRSWVRRGSLGLARRWDQHSRPYSSPRPRLCSRSSPARIALLSSLANFSTERTSR